MVGAEAEWTPKPGVLKPSWRGAILGWEGVTVDVRSCVLSVVHYAARRSCRLALQPRPARVEGYAADCLPSSLHPWCEGHAPWVVSLRGASAPGSRRPLSPTPGSPPARCVVDLGPGRHAWCHRHVSVFADEVVIFVVETTATSKLPRRTRRNPGPEVGLFQLG